MPIYEYVCRECDHEFEAWLRKEHDTASCPECKSEDLTRKISTPRVHSEGRKDRSMRAAKSRDAKQAKEAAWTQKQYELHHDDH